MPVTLRNGIFLSAGLSSCAKHVCRRHRKEVFMRYKLIRMLMAVTVSAILLAGCASSSPSAAAGSETGGADTAAADTTGEAPVEESVT
jgi:hypothetical protein